MAHIQAPIMPRTAPSQQTSVSEIDHGATVSCVTARHQRGGENDHVTPRPVAASPRDSSWEEEASARGALRSPANGPPRSLGDRGWQGSAIPDYTLARTPGRGIGWTE